MDYAKVIINIRQQLKDYIVKNNLKSLVIGISGGIDSCIVAALAKPVCDELNIHLIGLSLPTMTNTIEEIDRATRTCKAFCSKYKEIYLDDMFLHLGVSINLQPFNRGYAKDEDTNEENEKRQMNWKIRNGNIKARLRMIYLYNLASMNEGLVLSTDNYSEYMLGFWTIHGDVGDYAPIQELWKSEVYDLAEWLVNNEFKDDKERKNLLIYTISSMATDGLGVHAGGDLGQILPDWIGNSRGSSRSGYNEIDRILQLYLTNKMILDDIVDNPIIERHEKSKFKRLLPISISRKSLLYV